MDIAIVAVAYNRCDSLQRLLKSLEKAYYEWPVTLIISVDKSKTDVVEKFADDYQWPHGDKIVDKHDKNLGLRPHMMSLGKWFDRFDAIAVLEDDIVVSPNFYSYTQQTVEKYHNNPDIAGVSLYSFKVNYQTGIPFTPVKDNNDVYFMKCGMSWGEVWMRDSWKQFYEWYLNHQDFPVLPHLPYTICSWNDKSWLKYHTRYCIEENKFFVHPYVSLTTNYGDAGEHSTGSANTLYQVPLQMGLKKHYMLPELGEDVVLYDGFFENLSLYKILGLNDENLCLDLNGSGQNRQSKRYWLSTRVLDYKIIDSYGINYRPIELNIIIKNVGKNIYLYDTSIEVKNPNKKKRDLLLYNFHIANMFFFVRRYGYLNLLKDCVAAVKNKFGIK